MCVEERFGIGGQFEVADQDAGTVRMGECGEGKANTWVVESVGAREISVGLEGGLSVSPIQLLTVTCNSTGVKRGLRSQAAFVADAR